MPFLFRSFLLCFVAFATFGTALAAEDKPAPKPAEYKRVDPHFYPRGDVLRNHDAVIVPKGGYTQTGDSYFFTPKVKAPKEIFIEIDNDWVEPITPPDMPASLNIAPDAMQIREPQGDVTVALPAAPGNFGPVTDGMGLPNGAVVKTGPNSSTAILFGGVDSARLIPGSEAAVQQTVTADTRTVEVDLTVGAVFSKVGKQIGVNGSYEVHTPAADAIAHGTDFVTLIAQDHTDVWISQGTVELVPANAKKGESVTSDGTGPLKLIRYPAVSDPKASLAADSDALTAILNFIPMANQKVASLRAQVARGTPLSATQQDYLKRIKQVPAFIKLAYVEPPPPPPQLIPNLPPPPPKPETIVVHPNGTIKFLGATVGLAEFQAKLKTLITDQPDQAVIIKASPKVPFAKFEDVVKSVQDAQVKTVTIATPAPQPPPEPSATPTAETPPATSPAPAPPPPPPSPPAPLPVLGIDAVGTIFVDAAPTTPADLQAKLADIAKTNPAAQLTLVKRDKVTKDQWQKIVTLVHDAKIKVHVLNEKEYHATAAAFPPGPAAEPPPPTPLPVTGIDAVGTVFIDGAPTTAEALKSKVADLAKTNPASDFTLVKRPHVTKDSWQNLVAIFHDAKLKVHVVDEKEYHGATAPFPPGPAAEPPPPPPLPVTGIDAVGTVFIDGAPATTDVLKTKVADLSKTNPTSDFTLVKRPHVTKEAWQNLVTIFHDAKLKVHVVDEKEYHGASAAFPPGPAAEPPPPPPPVPLPVIGIDAMGDAFIDAAPVTDDALKSKFDDIAKTNPTQPLTLVKKPKVTHAQWQKLVDLAHAAKLRLSVVNEKEYKGTTPFPPEPPAPPPTAETPPAPAPAPAPAVPGSVDNAPPAVIGLDTDGSMTWDGAPSSEDDLKAKLADLAKTAPTQPLLLLKADKVTHEQWLKVVALVHDAKLKVLVKTAPSDNAPEPKPDYGNTGTEIPTPHLAATPAPQKLVPVEIDLKSDGRMTLDGNPVTVDDLKTKLTDLAKVNPQQPVLLVRTDASTRDQVNKIVALCHEAKLKVHIKTARTFAPPAPAAAAPEVPSSPAPNLPAPTVTMRPSIPDSSGETSAPLTNAPPQAGP